jgi:hypothetical protein
VTAIDRLAQQHWLRQVTTAERSFARVLRQFFLEQANALADAADDFGPNLPVIFRAPEWHQKLNTLVRRNLTGLMAAGASSELRAIEGRQKRRKRDDLLAVLLVVDSLPADVLAGIGNAVAKTMSRPYWAGIQDTVADDLSSIIAQNSLDGTGLAEAIRSELSDLAVDRAGRIATTETTGALNGGKIEAIDSAAKQGKVIGRKWLAIDDDVTRASHRDADGQIVGINEKFEVGGFPAAYPGDPALPGQERINCRCSVEAVMLEGADDDSGDGEQTNGAEADG